MKVLVNLRVHRDAVIAWSFAISYLVLLLVTAPTLGYARDEGFYFAAAHSYGQWFELLVQDPSRAFERDLIDRYWSNNHEHPAFIKSLFAISHHLLFEQWQLFREPGTSFRFPAMLLSAACIAITYAWGARIAGPVAGIVSAALLGFMPRVFYHSHLACFDMPVASMWLLTTFVYWHACERKRIGWILLCGLLYGLLLNTKHNSWLLPPALVLHYVVVHRRSLLRGARLGRLPVPSALLAMVLIGPLVFYATWPWIWHDTGKRLAEYVQFHMAHEYYNMEFLGRTYWKPPMPRSYAPLMTLATVPAITLLLFAIGSARVLLPALIARLNRSPEAPAVRRTAGLWLLCILTSYGPWVSSDTPIFGGTKHWITAYPFMCLLSGLGFEVVRRRMAEVLPLGPGLIRAAVPHLGLVAAVLLGPVVMTLHAHPWQLSAYTPLVGGAPGAATLGLNRTFWGYTTGSVQDYLNREVKPGQAVFIHDTALQSWEMFQRDGRLRPDIRPSWTIHGSDFALYHHEPHMSKVEYQAWVNYGTAKPAFVGTYDGVPVVWVYERPPPAR